MRLVEVRNTQRKFPVDVEAVQRSVAQIKAALGVSSFRVHVWFCSEPKMRELNDDWRDKRESTDVLSFPAYDFVAPGVFDPEAALHQDIALALQCRSDASSRAPAERLLGDIVLAPSYVQRQLLLDRRDAAPAEDVAGVSRAMATETSLERRLHLLLLHSMLHLLGYDHEEDADYDVMAAKEEQIMRELGWLK